jgi:hypothetical protein
VLVQQDGRPVEVWRAGQGRRAEQQPDPARRWEARGEPSRTRLDPRDALRAPSTPYRAGRRSNEHG